MVTSFWPNFLSPIGCAKQEKACYTSTFVSLEHKNRNLFLVGTSHFGIALYILIQVVAIMILELLVSISKHGRLRKKFGIKLCCLHLCNIGSVVKIRNIKILYLKRTNIFKGKGKVFSIRFKV